MGFVALEVTLELIEQLQGPLKRMKRGNRALADQLSRAALSIASNVSEGAGREGADRHHFWVIAHSSAREAKTQIRIALAEGYVDDVGVLGLVDRVCALTFGLKRTKN